jgi:hypothetical protein
VLDGVRDGLAHRELHVVAGSAIQAEIGRGSLGEITRLLEESEIRPHSVLTWLEVHHVCPRYRQVNRGTFALAEILRVIRSGWCSE